MREGKEGGLGLGLEGEERRGEEREGEGKGERPFIFMLLRHQPTQFIYKNYQQQTPYQGVAERPVPVFRDLLVKSQ